MSQAEVVGCWILTHRSVATLALTSWNLEERDLLGSELRSMRPNPWGSRGKLIWLGRLLKIRGNRSYLGRVGGGRLFCTGQSARKNALDSSRIFSTKTYAPAQKRVYVASAHLPEKVLQRTFPALGHQLIFSDSSTGFSRTEAARD